MAKASKTEPTVALPTAARVENLNPHDVNVQEGVALTGRYDVPAEEKAIAMAVNIAQYGQLTPIRVRQLPDGKYDPIFGRTRAEACRMIRDGFTSGTAEKPVTHAPQPSFTVKAEIVECDDNEAYRQAKIENFQRAELTIADIVANVTEMVESKGMKPKEIVEITGVNRSNITRYVKIGKYQHSEQLLAALHNDSIGMMTAYDITQETFTEEEVKALLSAENGCTQASVAEYLSQRKAAAKLDGTAATEPATEGTDEIVPAERTQKATGVTKANIKEQLEVYGLVPAKDCTPGQAHFRKMAVYFLSYIGGGTEEKPYTAKELHSSMDRAIKALDKQIAPGE